MLFFAFIKTNFLAIKIVKMKKNVLNFSVLALIATLIVFSGCKKPDNTAPVITLNGAASQIISLQSTYTELSATATDEKDGAITSTVSGAVNVNHTGTYTITYTATDAAGNVGTAIRTVTVVNDIDAMSGAYVCSGSTNYNDTLSASETINNRLHFGKFGNYQGNTNIYVNVANAVITLDSVLAAQVGSPPFDRVFEGTGTVISSTVFDLNYTETIGGVSSIKNEIFTKQ